jgi:hypothetical protein
VLRFPEKNDESNRVKCVAMFLVVSFACLSHTFAVLGVPLSDQARAAIGRAKAKHLSWNNMRYALRALW